MKKQKYSRKAVIEYYAKELGHSIKYVRVIFGSKKFVHLKNPFVRQRLLKKIKFRIDGKKVEW